MNKTIIYNIEKYGLAKICNLHDNGYQILCPVCQSELLFFNVNQSNGRRPGIYCPKNEAHVAIIYMQGRRKLWEKLDSIDN